MSESTPPTKVCPRCKRNLPTTSEYFNKSRGRRYNLSVYCRDCDHEIGKAHRDKNRDAVLQRKRRYYLEHRDSRSAPHAPAQRDIERFWSKVQKSESDACWEWTAHKHRQGYGLIWWGHRMICAHRIAYELAHGTHPGHLHVCHSCDNPSCCNPDHLFLGTHEDNMKDRDTKGRNRVLRGEENPMSKLTSEQVAEIRKAFKEGRMTRTDLIQRYGVSRPHLNRILNYTARKFDGLID